MESTTKENIYLALIDQCHEVINEISEKTKIMQPEVGCVKDEKPPLNRSQLDFKLQSLLAHLNDLNDKIFV